jgi:hypothetical protein
MLAPAELDEEAMVVDQWTSVMEFSRSMSAVDRSGLAVLVELLRSSRAPLRVLCSRTHGVEG